MKRKVDFSRAIARKEHLADFWRMFLGFSSLACALAGCAAALAENLPLLVLFHCLAAASGAQAGALADKRRIGRQFFPWIMALTVPLFGGIGAFFLLETMKRSSSHAILEGYTAYLQDINDAATYRESVPVRAQAMTETSEMVSLADVLANPASEAEQRIAIEHLADMESKSAFEILRRVVATPGTAGYFFAMTAMTQMEDKMLTRLQELEDALRTDGVREANVEMLLKAAQAYIDFIYFQFAVGERRQEYLERAWTLLSLVLDDPEASASELGTALLLMGRVNLWQHDAASALRSFSQYIERRPDLPQGYLWRAEAWYLQGDFARVRQDCLTASQLKGLSQKMQELIDLWLQSSPKAASAA